ncbi:MAG: NAD(P)/FAD-dependent oxidoreductase [Bacilli bacterium]|nr:NAD(P)/FAD-dependent oxidoreductase [Bacilli bacterium]
MEEKRFYKESYDVIVIGGALAGLSCAMKLASEGMDVLVLEKHNLPGGIATSFVRNGIEMEATLHEMMSIGPEDKPLYIREYLDQMKVAVRWLRVPENYTIYSPKDNLNLTLHPGLDDDGYFVAAKEIEKEFPGNLEKVNKLLMICKKVYESTLYLNDHTLSKPQLLMQHPELVKTAGYSTVEIMDWLGIPKIVQTVLSAYYVYVGQPLSTLPFTIYSFLMADYFLGGSFVARGFSHELALSMAERCSELGVQVEFAQTVEKILVKDRRVYGVRTAKGDEIHCKYVVSAPYPDTVYSKMIEPASEVPPEAIKLFHARKVSVSCFSVVMVLDKTPEELNISGYNVFSSDIPYDTDEFWAQGKNLGGWSNLSTICLNFANPDCVPAGMTSLSTTVLPLSESFFGVTADDYFEVKRKVAKEMIDKVSEYLGVNLLDHIVEIEIETPVTESHYCGQYLGCVYGYQHCMDDSIVARLDAYPKEHYIGGLTWASSAALTGNGMACNINNGRIAAKVVLTWKEEGK